MHGAGEERPAVGLGSEPELPDTVGALDTVELLGSATLTISSVRMLAVTCLVIVDKMVLTGYKFLHTVGAFNVLVSRSLMGGKRVFRGVPCLKLVLS